MSYASYFMSMHVSCFSFLYFFLFSSIHFFLYLEPKIRAAIRKFKSLIFNPYLEGYYREISVFAFFTVQSIFEFKHHPRTRFLVLLNMQMYAYLIK